MTNSYDNITTGSSFNALVNSGIVHSTAVLICPFIAAVAISGFGDFRWKSPCDTGPVSMEIAMRYRSSNYRAIITY